ncbi:hypothetical protein L6164_020938 [Bauhinia variegata]|uniref:Uncharacterized protein n=1 Tax=Bauhinia variegata TaxID=167791 RepID=A0ACB9MYN8_BAUVA|nr:hypothetical protein L6164_020938 [Bauhinia variegata]
MSIPSIAIYMGMSGNNLNGSLPVEVGTLQNLGVLDLSSNMLSGEIPTTLGSCLSLEELRMQDNFFVGKIPSSLSLLRGMEVLDFSHNNLSGNIPQFLEDFHLLRILNLSFNSFEGMVPEKGVFKNSSAVSVIGNSKLCSSIPELRLCKCKLRTARLTLTAKLIIAASVIVCVALAMSILFLLCAKKNRLKPTSGSSLNSLFQVSYGSLLKATDGFSSSVNLVNPRASRSFKAECEALRNIRHRNLVKLLVVCSSVDYQGNDFKALVYEFMVKGTLEEWLHPIISTENQTQMSLNLLQRLNIVIDVANTIEYLHHGCETPIVHCDLKPSNVLLDENMVGHVGDFGLARFFQEGTQNYSAPQSSTIEVRGTIGYTAPGLACSNEIPNERMNMKDATAQLITVKEKLLAEIRCSYLNIQPVASSVLSHR